MTRRSWAVRPVLPMMVVALGLCVWMAAIAPARADDVGARAFVETNIAHGIAILKEKSLPAAEQRQQIRDLLSNLLDTKKIGLFALGPARAAASPADLDAYVTAFNKFMIESYVTRLGGYGGQSLKVTGVMDHAPGDYVVTAVLVDPASPNDPDPVHIGFRVLQEGNKYAVVDASIVGVWLGLTQRDDFMGFLGQHNNSVPLLTSHLKEMTAQFEAQQAAPAAQ